MIYWAPLLHFYQPPTQLPEVVRRISDQCYRPLVRLFERLPHARATVNVNGSLTELWYDFGLVDVIDGFRELAERGQIEFTGSAKYHPIMPLLSADDARRQIALNRRINRTFFGSGYEPRGFFPPEMAFDESVGRVVADTGHRWVIASGIACPVDWPVSVVHHMHVGADDLDVLFRDDVMSNRIAFQTITAEEFVEQLRAIGWGNGDAYVITAFDAETFGHHIPGWETDFLERVYELIAEQQVADLVEVSELAMAGPNTSTGSRGHRDRSTAPSRVLSTMRSATISEIVEAFPRGAAIQPRASSWSTTAEDIAAGVPFPLWDDGRNPLHRLQWQHLEVCTELVRQAQRLGDSDHAARHGAIAQSVLDRAQHSCQFWWASRRPMWDVNMIHKGLLLQQEALMNAYKAIEASSADRQTKIRCYFLVAAARDIANKIVDQLFIG